MKPIPAPTQFGDVGPPWQLGLLDAFNDSVEASINDMGTYSNYLQDTSPTANAIVSSPAVGVTVKYSPGLKVQVRIANTNSSSTVTINIGGNGAVPVTSQAGTPLSPGFLLANGIYDMVFDGTSFQVLGVVFQTGTFTATFTGGINGSGVIRYSVTNGLSTLYVTGDIVLTGTSGGIALMSGMPTICIPNFPQVGTFSGICDTSPSPQAQLGIFSVSAVGVVTIATAQLSSGRIVAGGFTSNSSGTGLFAGTQFTYPLS